MFRPRVLLVAINARSIQANPALYSLQRAAARQGLDDMLQIYEYALHTPHQQILAELYEANPDIVAFSLYVWNARMIASLEKRVRNQVALPAPITAPRPSAPSSSRRRGDLEARTKSAISPPRPALRTPLRTARSSA